MGITIRTTWHASDNPHTIYAVLRAKLGREPTNAELKADVLRILEDGMIARAEQGKMQHQRKR